MAMRKTSRSRSRSASSDRSSRSRSKSQSRSRSRSVHKSSRSRSPGNRAEHAQKPQVKDENEMPIEHKREDSVETKAVPNGNHSQAQVKTLEENGKKESKSRSGSPRSKSRSRSRSVRSRSRSRSRSRRSGRKGRKRRHSSSSRSRSYSRSRSRSYRRSRSNGRRSRRGHRANRRSYSRSRSRSPYYRRQNPSPCRVLGVFGLNFKTEDRDLRRVFEKYGRLDKIKLVTDPRTSRSRGFAFIYFDSVDDAEEAKEKVHGQEIDGNRVRVEYSISNREHHPTPGVYMGRRAPPKYDEHKRRSRYSDSRSRSRTRSRSRSRSYDRRRRSYSRDY